MADPQPPPSPRGGSMTTTMPCDDRRSPGPAKVKAISGRHPVYRGVRCRSGKWVSEIREPKKATRIWLGTYPSAEMAAAAYDVAAMALKGPDTAFNFPDAFRTRFIPATPSPADIRTAAAAAALSMRKVAEGKGEEGSRIESEGAVEVAADAMGGLDHDQFVDEEALFDMPKLLTNMAEGMLVSPPRMDVADSDVSPQNSDIDSLWSYH